MEPVDEFLEHHGIKGQKWGIRNRNKKPVGPTSKDFKKSRKLQKRGSAALTNKELQDVNTRLNLEQNFHRMNPSKKAKGEAKVKAILGTIGVGVAALNSPPGRALTNAGKAYVTNRKRHSNKEILALKALSNSLVKK